MNVLFCKSILILFIFHLVFYSFFAYNGDEGRESMVIVIRKEKETIKKSIKNDILIKYGKINNLMWSVLKSR